METSNNIKKDKDSNKHKLTKNKSFNFTKTRSKKNDSIDSTDSNQEKINDDSIFIKCNNQSETETEKQYDHPIKNYTLNNQPKEQIIIKKRLQDISQDDMISIVISSNISHHSSERSFVDMSQTSYDKLLLSPSSTPSRSSNESIPMTNISLTETSSDFELFQENDYDTSKSLHDQLDKGIIIKKFNDYRPQPNKQYFLPPDPIPNSDPNEKHGISVIIPFFNEESYELQQTLNSIYDSYTNVRRLSKKWVNEPLYICLIQDGWNKVSKSMKIYLKHLFPKTIAGKGWWKYFPELNNYNNDTQLNMNSTFIIEREHYMESLINPQETLTKDRKMMKITLIVKANNRRKHNSHEWFLSETGFAEVTKAKYLFLTDAFTLYAEKCLYYLVNDLDKNKYLCGVTGRQRVMMRDQQGSTESIFSIGYVWRMVQLYDFEYANTGYNGAFALGGLLPVIPGPCGLYRSSDLLQNRVRDSYFDIVNEEPSNTGIVLGNLRIAEDRILTYYAVTKNSEEKYLGFNPLAVFYFEAETDIQKFILQRRRWINGSVAGYIYLLFQKFSDFKEWNVSIFRKIYVWILLMTQLIIYGMVGIGPGISLKIMYFGINYFLSYYKVDINLVLILLFVCIWAIYIVHVFVHHKNKFNYLIIYVLILFSLVTSLVLYAVLFHFVFIASNQPFVEMLKNAHPIVYMAIATFVAPFIISLFLTGRGHSFMYMIKSVIQYTLFVPLLVAWFGSYAYSRVWDLSWGNRPSSELHNITNEQKDLMVTKFKEKNVFLIFVLIVLNIAVFFIPPIGQLYLTGVFFAIALYQMFFSFIYCLTKINYKLQMIRKHYKKSKLPYSEDII